MSSLHTAFHSSAFSNLCKEARYSHIATLTETIALLVDDVDQSVSTDDFNGTYIPVFPDAARDLHDGQVRRLWGSKGVRWRIPGGIEMVKRGRKEVKTTMGEYKRKPKPRPEAGSLQYWLMGIVLSLCVHLKRGRSISCDVCAMHIVTS